MFELRRGRRRRSGVRGVGTRRRRRRGRRGGSRARATSVNTNSEYADCQTRKLAVRVLARGADQQVGVGQVGGRRGARRATSSSIVATLPGAVAAPPPRSPPSPPASSARPSWSTREGQRHPVVRGGQRLGLGERLRSRRGRRSPVAAPDGADADPAGVQVVAPGEQHPLGVGEQRAAARRAARPTARSARARRSASATRSPARRRPRRPASPRSPSPVAVGHDRDVTGDLVEVERRSPAQPIPSLSPGRSHRYAPADACRPPSAGPRS